MIFHAEGCHHFDRGKLACLGGERPHLSKGGTKTSPSYKFRRMPGRLVAQDLLSELGGGVTGLTDLMSSSCQPGVASTARREPSFTAFHDSSSTTSPTVLVVVFHSSRVFFPSAGIANLCDAANCHEHQNTMSSLHPSRSHNQGLPMCRDYSRPPSHE